MASKDDLVNAGKVAATAALAFGLATAPAHAMTKTELQQLSYLQVKGTGLANRCSDVDGDDWIKPTSGQKIVDMCIEPTSFGIEHEFANKKGQAPEKKFVPAHVMTRQTYTLDAVEGPLTVDNGKLVFHEKEGLDYSPVTLKDNTRGEGFPLLFNVKELVAEGSDEVIKPGFTFSGQFKTPSYRTGLFQDPKGRGGTVSLDNVLLLNLLSTPLSVSHSQRFFLPSCFIQTGYDVQPGLWALQTGMEGDDRIFKENNKIFDESLGRIEMQVDQVDDNEIGGVFVSLQKGDSDMGAHEANNILIKGKWYARVE